MTTFNHHLPLTGSVPQVTGAQGALARIADNAYLRLFVVVVIVAVGAAALIMGIGFLLDIVVPVIFADELRALAALFPQTAG